MQPSLGDAMQLTKYNTNHRRSANWNSN